MVFGGYITKPLSFFTTIALHRILESPVFLVTLCSALLGVLLGVIIVYVLKRRRPTRTNIDANSRRREPTGLEKILNGECILGWRLGLSRSSICEVCNQSNHCIESWYRIVPLWKKLATDPNTSFNSMSVFIATIHILRSGRNLLELRQQSLVMDDIFRTVWQLELSFMVTNGNELSFCLATHLTAQVIAVVFKQSSADHYRVILVHIVTRTHRTITVESPTRGATISGLRRGTVERSTLQMVFTNWIDDDGDNWLEFIVVSYKIPFEGEIDTIPVKPQSRKSMLFPLRQTRGLLIGGLVPFNPMTFILYYDIEQAGPDHRIFTLDEFDGWRIDSVDSWVTFLQSSPYTASILAAVESICQLSVPYMDFRYFPPSVRHFMGLVALDVGGAIFYTIPDYGVIQRLINPPTLKRLAAEALCKSKLHLDHSRLKQLSGVDIFDGITDKDEETVRLIE